MLSWYLIILSVCILAAPVRERIDSNGRRYKQGKIFAFATGFVLCFAACFRAFVGTDYWNYMGLYRGFLYGWKDYLLAFNEPGVPILCKLSSFFFEGYFSMFFSVSLLTISLYVRTIYKNSSFFWFTIMLYVLSGEWQHSFNGIKQYAAAAILFAGYRYLLNRQFAKYCAVVFFASCFHISALVMLPVFFITDRKITLKTFLVMLICVYVAGTSSERIFDVIGQIDSTFWMNDYVTEGVSWQRIAVSVVPLILYLFMPADFEKEPEARLLLNMCVLNTMIMLIGASSKYLARFSYYTQIYTCMALPLFASRIPKSVRQSFTFVTLLLYAIFWRIETTRPFEWAFGYIDMMR